MRSCFRCLASALLLASLPSVGQSSPSEKSRSSDKPLLTTSTQQELGVNTTGIELLSKAVELDSGLYLGKVLAAIRDKWYPKLPELQNSTEWKPGTTVIELEIEKKVGSLKKMRTIASAGQTALDQAAADAIASSAPFGPVPNVYTDKALKLRMHFGYHQPTNAAAPICDDRNHPERQNVLHETGKGISPPKATYQPDPEYSEEARKSKYQGYVILAGTVDTHGELTDLCVAQALGAGLDEKAIWALRTWRFEPATRAGEYVAFRVTVEVDFHLY